LAQAAAVDTTALGTKQLLEMELADLHEPLVADVPQKAQPDTALQAAHPE
jgi:hypothetical protein